jgi:ABC-type branched-subunit amino acid transport system substrate-binding protein
VGTATSQTASPVAVQKKTLFFGSFSGASSLRLEPPERYVFNYRASYDEETAYIVRYLVDAQKTPVSGIVVFAQSDSFGDAGFEGVAKALRKRGYKNSDVLRVSYDRNSLDVSRAVEEVVRYHNARAGEPHPVRAVVMIATYKAAARFIREIRARKINALCLTVSFVGSNQLVEELRESVVSDAAGTIITQVVPHYESASPGVIVYRAALKKYHPDQEPGFVSLEGFLAGSVLVEGLRKAGRELDTEKLINALEAIRGLDLGIGALVNLGPSEHQGMHRVWGTVLGEDGRFRVLVMD